VAALPQQATSLGTLSALPPEMLTHIMSFVPFEDLIVKVACLNRDWNKLVEDDSLWKMAFGRLWHKEVQEEEERKKLRRKALMEREYQAKKKKLEEDYERKRRELEEEYDKKRKKLESKKKEESWKQVFEQHYVVQKVRRPPPLLLPPQLHYGPALIIAHTDVLGAQCAALEVGQGLAPNARRQADHQLSALRRRDRPRCVREPFGRWPR
jgi:hypothetical protein